MARAQGIHDRCLAGIACGLGMALTLLAAAAHAHQVEVFAGPGFRFGGILDTEAGEVDITNTVGLTTTLAVRAREDACFEFTYSFQPASLEVEDVTGPALTAFDLGVHYIQLGGIVEWPHAAGTPFFGLTAGVAVFDPEPEDFTTETRFAGSLFWGVKRMLTPRVGLRGEGRIWMTYFPEDVNLFCSLPGYCAISVSGEALFQGETAGGVFVTF
jgi:hypothetical protein